MATPFPGLEEVIKFLQEQDAAERAKARPTGTPSMSNVPGNAKVKLMPARQFPVSPSMSNVPVSTPTGPLSVGNFAKTAGSAARGAAKAVTNPVVLALAGPAWKAGEILGEGYNDLTGRVVENGKVVTGPRGERLARERQQSYGSLPTPEEMGYNQNQQNDPRILNKQLEAEINSWAVPPGKTSSQAAAVKPYMPEEITTGTSQTPVSVKIPQSAEEVPAEMLVPAQEAQAPQQEADAFMQQVLQLLEPQQPVQESPASESTKTIAEMTAPRDVAQKEPTSMLGKIGRGINKFLVAGAGPYDPTRYDRQQLELANAKRQFTPQEKLKGELAVEDISGSRKFNRESQLQVQGGASMTPQTKFMLDLIGGERQLGQRAAAQQASNAQEHGYRMQEIAASGANQKLTPEAQRGQLRNEMLTKYPDIFTPEVIAQETGLSVSPEALKVIQDARLKNDPMAMMVTELLKQRLGNVGTVGQSKKPLATRALSGEK